jgi:hypothetical protein
VDVTEADCILLNDQVIVCGDLVRSLKVLPRYPGGTEVNHEKIPRLRELVGKKVKVMLSP